MNQDTYNGWTNWETWLTNLWLSDDEDTWSQWANASRIALQSQSVDEARYDVSKQLKESFSQQVPEQSGLFTDFIIRALREVNWEEIASHLVDNAD